MKKLTNSFRIVYNGDQIISIEENAIGITYVADTLQCEEFDTIEELQEFIADNHLTHGDSIV